MKNLLYSLTINTQFASFTRVFFFLCFSSMLFAFSMNNSNSITQKESTSKLSDINFDTNQIDDCEPTKITSITPPPTIETKEQIFTCYNDSILLFNEWQIEGGFYQQSYTAANGCDSVHTIELLKFPELFFDTEIQASCPFAETGEIDLYIRSGAAPLEFEWSNGVTDETKLEGIPAGNYTLTLTDANNCSEVFDFTVPEEAEGIYLSSCPRWYTPNAFSPNRDGNNDRFFIYGNDKSVRIKQLQIWDNWGELVFQVDDISLGDYNMGWDGMLKGRPLQPAVFVWKATLLLRGEILEVVYGDLTLMR